MFLSSLEPTTRTKRRGQLDEAPGPAGAECAAAVPGPTPNNRKVGERRNRADLAFCASDLGIILDFAGFMASKTRRMTGPPLAGTKMGPKGHPGA